jgi:hypothetical protein
MNKKISGRRIPRDRVISGRGLIIEVLEIGKKVQLLVQELGLNSGAAAQTRDDAQTMFYFLHDRQR